MDNNERKEKFMEMGQIVQQAGKLYTEYLMDRDNTTYIEKIIELEAEADRIQAVLYDYYTSQSNIPYLTLDRAKLLDKMDEIMDQTLLASKTLKAFGSALPQEFKGNAAELGDSVKQMTLLLSQSVTMIYSDFKSALEMTQKMETIRDQATDTIFNLEQHYFNADEYEKDWKVFTSISRISRRTMAIVNATKSASELIALMCMKYV